MDHKMLDKIVEKPVVDELNRSITIGSDITPYFQYEEWFQSFNNAEHGIYVSLRRALE